MSALASNSVGGMAGLASSSRTPAPMRMPAATVCLRLRHAALEGRADLEQHQIVKAARLIARRRRQQRRQQRGPQRIEIGGDGIFELARVVAAAEQRGVGARDEGKADRLVEAARGQRCGARCGRGAGPASAPAARWRAAATAAPTAHGRGRGCARLLPPDRRGRRRRCARRAASPAGRRRARHREAETGQDADDLVLRHIEAAQPSRPAPGSKSICLCGRRQLRRRHDLGRLAAAPFQDQLRGQLQARHHEFRIDAALEAIARVGDDAAACGRSRAMRTGSNQADSMKTFVVVSVQPVSSPPITPAMPRAAASSAMTTSRRRACRSCRRAPAPARRPWPGAPADCRSACRHRTHAAAGRGRARSDW